MAIKYAPTTFYFRKLVVNLSQYLTIKNLSVAYLPDLIIITLSSNIN